MSPNQKLRLNSNENGKVYFSIMTMNRTVRVDVFTQQLFIHHLLVTSPQQAIVVFPTGNHNYQKPINKLD